ncbi:SIMPL domain-containing protein [Pontibacter sp. E15-1]|uniref:SIMPL domain-containing protein n=1 Tax=Pontibacter sp. E15-1 TaxID=2919918 RepID=UPI001F4FEBFA|nr:SIMPL domain-containing protein [Pontibacter sp. E15-1]MCJ8166593.1 SIMPL domain-containing protein [Pontibacter sp. E15-1]
MNKGIYLIAILLLQSFDGLSQTKSFIDQPFIETAAQVDTLVTPDRIFLNIVLTEKDNKGKSSVEELEARMEATLKQIGINTRQNLMLNDLASNFRKHFLKQQDILKRKEYTLMVTDALTAGRVILALEEIDISNVVLDRTEYAKIEQLQLDLKSRAISKAKQQAVYMAAPLNQKIGPAIYISDQSHTSVNNTLQGRVAGVIIRGYTPKKNEEFKPADIEFEKIKVASAVEVKFKLEQ